MAFTSFTDLCNVLELLSEKTAKEGKSALERIFKHLRNNQPELLIPVIRLFCIALDRRRGPFQLGNDKIARLLISTLNIDKSSKDARTLLNYKQSTTDFAQLVRDTIESRVSTPDSNLSFIKVHDYLDQIAQAELKQKEVIFQDLLINILSAREMFWFTRIILKDLRIRLTGENILLLFAPEAKELWATHTDLEFVINATLNPSTKSNQSITIGHSFKPMLSKRAMTLKDPFVKSKMLFVEEKIDGERIMLHKNKDSYKYYTKNYQDDTTRYGTISEGNFTPNIKNQIKSISCILDGEMIAIKNNRVLRFGTLRKFFGHVNDYTNTIDEDVSGATIKYMVFDILNMGNKDLTHLDLQTRKCILDKVVVNNDFIQKLDYNPCDNEMDLQQLLQQALDDKKEGLVVKDPRSQYICGGRGYEWFKCKAGALSSLGYDFDFVIVGGYYGKGSNSGTLVTFLCALIKDKSAMSLEFSTICKISSFKKEEKEYVQEQFDQFGQAFMDKEWLDHPNRNKPDYLIDPKECSIIVEVTGHEFTPLDPKSKDFGFSHTIRFPNFKQMRIDKALEDCESIEDIRNYIDQNHMIVNRAPSLAIELTREQNIPKQPAKKRKGLEIIDRPQKIKKIKATSNILTGYSFICTDELQNLIMEMDGDIGPKGNDIVVENELNNKFSCTEEFIRHIHTSKTLSATNTVIDKCTSYDLSYLSIGNSFLTSQFDLESFKRYPVKDHFKADLVSKIEQIMMQ